MHNINQSKHAGAFNGTSGFDCFTVNDDYPCLYSNGDTGNKGYIVWFPLDPMNFSALEPMDLSETVTSHTSCIRFCETY